MPKRLAALSVVVALFAAACGAATDAAPAPGGGANAMLLSYSYTPGGDVVYDFDMTLDMVMKMKGGEGFGGPLARPRWQ